MVLLLHRLGEHREQINGGFHIGFIVHWLGHHHDESSGGEGAGPLHVAVDVFTGVANEYRPSERSVARHLLVLAIEHRWIDHSNLRGKRPGEVEICPPNGEINALVAGLEGRLFIKQCLNAGHDKEQNRNQRTPPPP